MAWQATPPCIQKLEMLAFSQGHMKTSTVKGNLQSCLAPIGNASYYKRVGRDFTTPWVRHTSPER